MRTALMLRITVNNTKDKSVIISMILEKNIIIDNLIKFQLPSTWNREKEQPRERVLSFLASIVNMHISTFIRQIFKRNLIETSIVPDSEGNSKSDRYRNNKMKLNEEYVFSCSYDMSKLTDKLFKKYENEITKEEIDYYRRNLKPSRLQQLMIEIYFFNYTSSSQEFALLKNIDWYKLLLIMRKDIMRRFSIDENTLLDSSLSLILTANITEVPVGEKVHAKDMKVLNDDPNYNLLINKFYSTVVTLNEDIIKKFLITFMNSKYEFVLYEERELLGQEISINKKELMNELIDFLIMANNAILLNK